MPLNRREGKSAVHNLIRPYDGRPLLLVIGSVLGMICAANGII